MKYFSMTISNVLIFVLFVTLTLITSVLGVHRQEAMENELDESLDRVATRLKINLASSLYDMDMPQVNAIIHSEMRDRNLYAVIIREPDGRFFHSAGRDDWWEILEGETKAVLRYPPA